MIDCEECKKIDADIKILTILHTMMGMNYGEYHHLENELLYNSMEEAELALKNDPWIKWRYVVCAHNCICYTKTLKDVLFSSILNKNWENEDDGPRKKARLLFDDPEIKMMAIMRDVVDHAHLIPAEFKIIQTENQKYQIKMLIKKDKALIEKMNQAIKKVYEEEELDLSPIIKNYFNKITELFIEIDEEIRKKNGIPYTKVIKEQDDQKETIIGNLGFNISITKDIDVDEKGNLINKGSKIIMVMDAPEEKKYPEGVNEYICKEK